MLMDLAGIRRGVLAEPAVSRWGPGYKTAGAPGDAGGQGVHWVPDVSHLIHGLHSDGGVWGGGRSTLS